MEDSHSENNTSNPIESETEKAVRPINPPQAPRSFENFVSVPWKPLHGELFQKVFQLILEKGLFFNGSKERSESPYKFRKPEQLEQLIDFKLGENGSDHDTLFNILEKVIEYSPHHSHPFYLAKFSAGLDPYGIAADMIAGTMTSAVLTYFFAPIYTLMEEEVKKRVRELVGYPKGKGDGLIAPGAEFANMMAVRMALQKKYPNLKEKGYTGIGNPRVCVFISEHAGKDFERAVMMTGIGTARVIPVKTDKYGRIDVAKLTEAVASAKVGNLIPLMVVATAGTPSLGSIDPIDEIATFCKENKIWLHVDADYGGSYLFSEKYKGSLKGIERSHSFNWSPCGIFGSPICCNILVTRYDKLCTEAFALGAKYVFEKNDLYDFEKWDNGDGTIQTSRKGLILKLWFMWKAKGKTCLRNHVDYTTDLSKFFIKEICERRNPFNGKPFQLILEDYDTTRVSFYYVPPTVRFLDRGKDYGNPLVKPFAKKLKSQLLLQGVMELGISSLPEYPDFFTISVTNSALTRRDLSYVLDQIEYYGQTLNPLSTIFGGSRIDNIGAQEDEILRAIPNPPKEYPSYVSAPIEAQHKSFFKMIFKLISEKALYFQEKRAESPFNFRKPEQLLEEFDFDLTNTDGIKSENELVKILENVIFYSIHQAHPYYLFQLLSGGLDPYSLMAEFIFAAMTSGMLTYEESPVYTLMEREVFRAVKERIGYPPGEDGILCPGGSISVITAIYVARYSKFPQVKTDGATKDKLVLYLSVNAHYCFLKGGSLQGVGLDQCVLVDVDSAGKMSIPALEAAILKTLNEGGTPFLVGATSGTTVLGVYDPLDEIANICQKYKLWLHADASVGGSYIMSDKILNTHLKGIERTNSMNFNPHKSLGLSQETSILVFQKPGIVGEAFAIVDYATFPPPLVYNWQKYDVTCHGGMQRTRSPQILKFWLVWKAKGIKGMGQHVDYTYHIKDLAVAELKKKKRIPMYQIWQPDFECPVISFHYIPLSLRGLDRNSAEFKERVQKPYFQLTADLVRKGVAMVGVIRDPQENLILKLVLMSSGLIPDDIKYVFDQIDNYGADIVV